MTQLTTPFSALTEPADGLPLMPTDIKHLRTWILHDGRAGHLNQSLGIVEALGIKEPVIQNIVPKHPFHRLRRWFLPLSAWELPEGPYPQLLIATGWKNSYVSRLIKHINPSTFTVQMMRPSGDMDDYDVVAMPLHDNPPPHENVVATIGAPNRIFPDRLELEADRWEKRLQHCPRPRLAVLIGGPTRGIAMEADTLINMVEESIQLAQKHEMSLLVTTSRRTPISATVAAEKQLESSGIPHYFWRADNEKQRDNPFLAYLATAQAAVVSADSVSMISETCTAGLPTYIWGKELVKRKKFTAFFESLNKQKRIAPFQGKLDLRAPTYPLSDTRQVAGFIQGKIARKIAGI